MSEGAHRPAAMPPVEQRVAALEALLTERGLIPEGFIDQTIHRYETEIGPMNGAKVVARAWADPQYRQRLLAEMGCDLPPDTEIRVWDSSAEVRYLVLPQRPAGTEGMTEADLAGLVTRDSMIGVARL